MLQDSVLSTGWIARFTAKDNAPALWQIAVHGRAWLLPIVLLWAGCALALVPSAGRRTRADVLLALGALGFAYTLAQGFAIGARGFSFEALAPPSASSSPASSAWGWARPWC